jgi:hypothetical protein
MLRRILNGVIINLVDYDQDISNVDIDWGIERSIPQTS